MSVAAGAPNSPFRSTDGWEMFQCPALPNGGLPPANTYPGNSDGLPNESGIDPTTNLPVIDYQAPRLAYTVNEAICPRGIFVPQFGSPSRGNVRVYRFIPASKIRNSSNVILAAELWGTQAAAETTSLIDGVTIVSNSRRPVNGINAVISGCPTDQPYKLLYTRNFSFATPALGHDPEATMLAAAGSGTPPVVNSTLDYIGRNHGSKKYGAVGGFTGSDWDLRTSNFLYCDGHVENKHVAETVYPASQWGEDFYTLHR
jgi:prepilin-type processing-associated H-X9-DG protein